jgi:hypothetical protein
LVGAAVQNAAVCKKNKNTPPHPTDIGFPEYFRPTKVDLYKREKISMRPFEVLFVIFFAAVFSMILVSLLKRRGPGPASGLLFYFALLFLAIWAFSSWMVPIGPPIWGVSWIGILIVALLLSLFLAAVTVAIESGGGTSANPTEPENESAKAIGVGFGLFFCLLALLLVAAIVAGHLRGYP